MTQVQIFLGLSYTADGSGNYEEYTVVVFSGVTVSVIGCLTESVPV